MDQLSERVRVETDVVTGLHVVWYVWCFQFTFSLQIHSVCGGKVELGRRDADGRCGRKREGGAAFEC